LWVGLLLISSPSARSPQFVCLRSKIPFDWRARKIRRV